MPHLYNDSPLLKGPVSTKNGEETANRDYNDMRKFQAKFIDADHRVRALEEQADRYETALQHIAKHESGEWPGACLLGETPGIIASTALSEPVL